MWNAERTALIVFNGEIYNYRELRARTSYPYRTQSDTEIILALYRQHGTAFVPMLKGMFAFAIFDLEKQHLFCARDRFGEKPFFYSQKNDAFYFASEVKGLFASGAIAPEVDPEGLSLLLKYLYVPQGSFFRNIQTLPPAHTLTVALNGRMELLRYWEPPASEPDAPTRFNPEELRHLVQQAVSRCMVADVPVGCLLSGGLDSTTVAFEMSRLSRQVKSYAFKYDLEIDETPFAADAAKAYGTEHTELSMPDYALESVLEKLASVFEEPLADPAAVGNYLLFEQVREHVKVALGGDGADELFGGYQHWYTPLLAENTQNAQAFSFAQRLKRKVGLSAVSPVHLLLAHRGRISMFGAEELSSFTGFRHSDVASEGDGYSLDTVRKFDCAYYLPGDILVKVDRTAMAHGLEIRAPFLDVDLATYCMKLPFASHMEGGVFKKFLRQAYAASWPERIRQRGKQGFGGPVNAWFREGKLDGIINRLVQNNNHPLYNLLAYDRVKPVLAEKSYRSWTIVVLGLWAERWI
jgi:asparagine synthase (glutamine-hydrolysing)